MDKLALIAHRGNTSGINHELENKKSYLNDALMQGYWIECDVQMYKEKLYLGHDEPQEQVDEIIMNPHTICHAKDLDSIVRLNQIKAHAFWHETDRLTITNRGFFWCYPGVHVTSPNAIWLDLLNRSIPKNTSGIFGICSDNFSLSGLV
ncbi:MAG: hypothetical protein CBD16_00545 [Betaproteobacteria bacterium TMED156]|nr:MAG: hypothetical protein CBD16_00545 [Betaproteobacteria bacterium TMED156]